MTIKQGEYLEAGAAGFQMNFSKIVNFLIVIIQSIYLKILVFKNWFQTNETTELRRTFSIKFFICIFVYLSEQSIRRTERDLGEPLPVLRLLGAGQLQQEREDAECPPPGAHLAWGDISSM